MLTRDEIRKALEEENYSALEDASGGGRSIFRPLISLSYDKESVLCWRAIEAIGRVTGQLTKSNGEETRNLVQRLLWMMRDESGNNVGSAPEILGEIVRNSPDQFSDIAPIIASFHDEEGLRRGVFRALMRISEIRPDLCLTSSFLVREYITCADGAVRAYAVLLAGSLGLKASVPLIEGLLKDACLVTIYGEGKLQQVTVSEIAEATLNELRMGGDN